MLVVSEFGRLRQEDLSEFEALLSYKDPVSKNEKAKIFFHLSKQWSLK